MRWLTLAFLCLIWSTSVFGQALAVTAVTTVQPAQQGSLYQNPEQQSGTVPPGGGVVYITGGTGPYTPSITAGALPAGMSISVVTPAVPNVTPSGATATGLVLLTGTPSTAGDYSFTVKVTDNLSATSSANCTFIVVASSLPALSSITAVPGVTTATITWTTNPAADSAVIYGPTDDFEKITPVQDTGGLLSHSVNLSNLPSGGQTINYKVRSCGISGGVSQDYLCSFSGNFTFSTSTAPTTGTLDFGFYLQGPHTVVQSYPTYISISPYLIAGTSSYSNGTLKFQVTGIPANTQVHWPDEQDNGYGGNGCSVSSGASTNDTMTCYSFEGTQFDLLTNVGGTTSVGSYTLVVTTSINNGAVSHSQNYALTVAAAPSFPFGVPPSYPAIPNLSTWSSNMTTYGTTWGINTACGAGYDQGVSFYDGFRVFQRVKAYTNDPTTWNPAIANLATCYRDNYVIANTGHLSGIWVFPHGLYYDCIGGSTTSCTALHDLAVNAAGASTVTGGYVGSTRIREACYMLGAKRLDYDAGGGSTLAQVKQMAAYCLGAEDQIVNNSAYYPFENFFMDGLLAQALIEYWADPNTGNGDVRVPAAIKALADHMWSTGWIPWAGTNGSFIYNTFQHQNLFDTIFPQSQLQNLNLLEVPLFAWLFSQTGLSQYQLEGDTIFNAGVNTPNAGGIGGSGKNYSQQYHWSFDYVTWRSAPVNNTQPAPVAILAKR